jgi:Sulfotransferase domain
MKAVPGLKSRRRVPVEAKPVAWRAIETRAGRTVASMIQRSEIRALGRFEPPGYRLPDFVGIGSAQSGTTWLYENLRIQPGLYLSAMKEVKFWDRYSYLPIRWYSKWFNPAGERLAGEITPSYCALPVQAISKAHRVVPHARIIYLLRNPIDREWSAARRIASRTYERPEDLEPCSWLEFLTKRTPNPLSDHAENLRRWRSIFPSDQVLTVFYEELETAPAVALQRIGRHLGLSRVDVSAACSIVNANPQIAMPAEVHTYLAQEYEPIIEGLRAEFPAQTQSWL